MKRGGWLITHPWLLALLLFSGGCVAPRLEIASSALSFEQLKEKVARIRGLSFQRDPSLDTIPARMVDAAAERSLWEEEGKESLQQKSRVYARLGLLPEGTDLSRGLLDLRLSREVAYDPRAGAVFLPKGPLRPDPALPAPSLANEETTRQLLLVSELCYILQEQHFRLEERLENRNTEDSRLALRAVKKGDAVLIEMAYLLGGPKEDKEKVVDGIKALSAAPIDRELSRIPELLRREASFQYLQGSAFVSWAYFFKGWEGVNALLRNPPLSTHQILHPENYYSKREDPLRIIPWGLSRQLVGKKIMDDTLGEFLIRLLLSRTLSSAEARQAAAGWAGDSLLAFQQGQTLVLGWVTAWDRPQEAGQFFTSFRRALETRHGISLERSAAAPDTLISPAEGGAPLLLQMKDRFVFFLDGVAAPRSEEIAAAIWSDLETGSEPEPLELSQASLTPLPSESSAPLSW